MHRRGCCHRPAASPASPSRHFPSQPLPRAPRPLAPAEGLARCHIQTNLLHHGTLLKPHERVSNAILVVALRRVAEGCEPSYVRAAVMRPAGTRTQSCRAAARAASKTAVVRKIAAGSSSSRLASLPLNCRLPTTPLRRWRRCVGRVQHRRVWSPTGLSWQAARRHLGSIFQQREFMWLLEVDTQITHRAEAGSAL